jgi:hypothetical protein
MKKRVKLLQIGQVRLLVLIIHLKLILLKIVKVIIVILNLKIKGMYILFKF